MLHQSRINQDIGVIVSGAGITGISSALYCNSRGIPCEIHEEKSTLGGILQDWQKDGDWYYRNCQYLTPGTDWFYLLPQCNLLTFPHTYGSYTDLWGETCAFRGFAGPVYSLKSLPGELRKAPIESLRDRLNIYPQAISDPLIEWVRRFGISPETIHYSGATGFKISRVFPSHFVNDIQSLKERDYKADEFYGIPRQPSSSLFLATLPIGGFSHYFQNIEKNLIDSKIILRLNSRTKANILPGFLNSNQNSATKPVIVWTGNPVPLIKWTINQTLDAPWFRMRNIVMKWENHHFITPFYIQVFSRCYPITRIFVYFNKATVECFYDDSKTYDVVLTALEILLPFLGKIEKPQIFHEFTEKRYFLCTIRDYTILEQLVDESAYSRLIPSPWHVYGRDSKIKEVLRLLTRHFPL